MNALVECVPNFSEGRNREIIDAISNAISQTKGCYLLDVDAGGSTNRTVYSFVGEPNDVVQGALAAARVGYKLINMENHKGEHPRIGAMDVCPFIPVKNITIDECVELSKKFAKFLSDELNVPVYLYGESQHLSYRKELSSIRQGEYEGLKEKLNDPKMIPDYGPCEFKSTYGASCVGARNFLIAYNVNILGTKEQAHRIALNIREQGRSEKEPGRCKKVKAIGWFLEEENMAQVSMNLVDYKTTNLHQCFEECQSDANEIQVATCGSQIVGLLPLESVLMAADYYIKRDKLLILEESLKVKMVIHKLGLDSISKFDPNERIIEYIIQKRLTQDENKYQNVSVKTFIELVGARSSLPGGGCVAALVASLGSSLATMASYLTYGNRKYESLDAQIREVLPEFHKIQNELMHLIDQDAIAFNSYVAARKMPDKTKEDKVKKDICVQNGLYRCIEVPYTVAAKAYSLWPFMHKLAPIFNIQTKSDLLVAVKCLETGIFGAYANVQINSKDFNGNDSKVNEIVSQCEKMWSESKINAENIISLIEKRVI